MRHRCWRDPCARAAMQRLRQRSSATQRAAREAERLRRVCISSERTRAWSGAFQGALGHERSDLEFLDLYAHTVRDLDRHETVADLENFSEKTSRGHHFITGGKLRHHRLVLLGLSLLR